MTSRPWTEPEKTIVRLHYSAGGPTDVYQRLRSAGYDRTTNAIALQAHFLGVYRRARPLTGPANTGAGGGILPSFRAHYPAHIARRLHTLAESQPTPDEYRQRKETILAGNL